MDSWIKNSDNCLENELGSLLEEYMTDDYLVIAFFTDRFQAHRGDHLNSVLASTQKLLELRVFNENCELWLHRSCCGKPFSWRLASEAGCDPQHDYFRTVQALDIDESYAAYQCGETDGYGSLKLRSTVQGYYVLPLCKGDECVKVINYVRYDDATGVAEAADYRLAGFASMIDGADWKKGKGGTESAGGD